MLNQQWQKKQFMEAKETFADGGGRNYANNYFSNQSRQDAISRVSAVQKSARGPRWELWRSGGWNIRSHQRCRLQRDGYDFYGYPPLHLEAHAYCTKAKKHSNFRHNLFDTGSPMSKSCVLLKFLSIVQHWKPPPKWQKMTSFRGAMGRHGQAGSWRGQWTGWIGSAPVQISGCGLDGALSWCGQGEGRSFLMSSWVARAVAAAQSFQTCFACVHMYILYACVHRCVCLYVCGHDICIYMHVCVYLYIYAIIHVCMCICMHICA